MTLISPLTRWLFELDTETGVWQCDLRQAGPAGVVQLDLPVGVVLTFDRAIPTVLVAVDIFHPTGEASEPESLNAALVALGLSSVDALHLAGSVDPSDSPVVADVEGGHRVWDLLSRRAALEHDRYALALDEQAAVAAILQFEEAWLNLQLPPAFGLDEYAAMAIGAGTSLWRTTTAQLLHDTYAAPFVDLVELAEDLSRLTRSRLAERVAVLSALDEVLRSLRTLHESGQIPELLATWADESSTQDDDDQRPRHRELVTLGSAAAQVGSAHDTDFLEIQSLADVDLDPIGWVRRTLRPENTCVKITAIGVTEVPPKIAARLGILPQIVVETEGGEAVLRALSDSGNEPLWVYVHDQDRLVLAAPFTRGNTDWSFRLDEDPDLVAIVVAASPAARRPDTLRAVDALEGALHDADTAIGSEQRHDWEKARMAWVRCAAKWLMLDDPRRCSLALRYAASPHPRTRTEARDQSANQELLALAEAIHGSAVDSRPIASSALWQKIRDAVGRGHVEDA